MLSAKYQWTKWGLVVGVILGVFNIFSVSARHLDRPRVAGYLVGYLLGSALVSALIGFCLGAWKDRQMRRVSSLRGRDRRPPNRY